MIQRDVQKDLCNLEMADGKVNLLGLPMRIALLDALQAVQNDDAIRAVVLAGRGRCFSAGMNVEDFDAGTALKAPSLHNEILDCLANMSKPVIAAIHGGAHGGGLELALGCHYRVATQDAEVSLPEILVGLIPGARGTQHLPRAVGQKAAADMILNGRRVRANEAPFGLFDRILAEPFLDSAIAFAGQVASKRPIPHLQRGDVAPASVTEHLATLANAPDYPGVEPAIAMLKASVTEPFSTAIAQEFAAFSKLSRSPRSAQFRASFLAKLKATSIESANNHSKSD